jgi:hypothetical protein
MQKRRHYFVVLLFHPEPECEMAPQYTIHGLQADRTFYLDHDSLLIQIMYRASSFGRLLCMSSLIGKKWCVACSIWRGICLQIE